MRDAEDDPLADRAEEQAERAARHGNREQQRDGAPGAGVAGEGVGDRQGVEAGDARRQRQPDQRLSVDEQRDDPRADQAAGIEPRAEDARAEADGGDAQRRALLRGQRLPRPRRPARAAAPQVDRADQPKPEHHLGEQGNRRLRVRLHGTASCSDCRPRR